MLEDTIVWIRFHYNFKQMVNYTAPDLSYPWTPRYSATPVSRGRVERYVKHEMMAK